VAELSEWLKIMLGEVARKREEQSRAGAESAARSGESNGAAAAPAPADSGPARGS
jgi:hypothetical protein